MGGRPFKIVKGGGVVKALLDGGHGGRHVFHPAKAYEPIRESRVFGVDSESLRSEAGTGVSHLRTLITTLRFHDGGKAIETPMGMGMLERLCDEVMERFGVDEGPPSDTVQRKKHYRPGSRRSRDGRRKTIEPALSVWFNLAYDFGRLAADSQRILRSVVVGADSYRFLVRSDIEGPGWTEAQLKPVKPGAPVNENDVISLTACRAFVEQWRRAPRYEIEVARMNFGTASNFEWYIRDRYERRIARLIGIDMTGYWKASLEASAKSLGIKEKASIEKLFGMKAEEFFQRTRESFSPEEWETFRDVYALTDPETTLELYHRTVGLLRTIDARVVRKTGVIPVSAPGAAARIVFAKAFDQHPELLKENGGPGEWERPPRWADQMGCDSYFGGRVFCTRPGVHQNMVTLDIRSAYPYALACLPDPVGAEYEYVSKRRTFKLEDWAGKWGVLYIDGENLDPHYPALRTHDFKNRRLRYVHGAIENQAATIPEVVMGVISGALRVDRIVRGVVMHGDPATSFFRAGMRDFFNIKNDPGREKALRDMAKLFANSTYGKTVEVNATEYMIAENLPMPNFLNSKLVAETMARIYAEAGPPMLDEDDFAGSEKLPSSDRSGDNEVDAVRRIYAESVALLDDNDSDRNGQALLCYLDALRIAGVESQGMIAVGDFMRAHRTYRCGQYFLPLCASLVTGLTSATVGLLSRSIEAWQGDTDSVHIALDPRSVDKSKLVEGARARDLGIAGWDRFEAALATSGYGQPIDSIPDLGQWFLESPGLSVESVLVRPKVYSHVFNGKDGLVFKQAKHGFAKWPNGARPGESPQEAARRSKNSLHQLFKVFLRDLTVNYQTKATPRKLRSAVAQGLPVGEFVSNQVTLTLEPDPNTWLDETGRVQWRQGEVVLAEAAE